MYSVQFIHRLEILKIALMDGTFVRTSVTVDEAVAILLGWAKGPIRYTSSNQFPSEEEQDELDHARFSLADELEDRQCSCESDLEDAKDDGQTEAVVAEKRAAIEKHGELTRLAATYLCAINDEINKGEQSGLRVDKGLSNSIDTYITLTSLDEWAKERYDKPVFKFAEGTATTAGLRMDTCIPLLTRLNEETPEPDDNKPSVKLTESAAITVEKKPSKMSLQGDAILEEIARRNFDPLQLPRTVGSKPGVKAAVKMALAANPLFKGKSTFKHAWDRLRAPGVNQKIRNAEET